MQYIYKYKDIAYYIKLIKIKASINAMMMVFNGAIKFFDRVCFCLMTHLHATHNTHTIKSQCLRFYARLDFLYCLIYYVYGASNQKNVRCEFPRTYIYTE